MPVISISSSMGWKSRTGHFDKTSWRWVKTNRHLICILKTNVVSFWSRDCVGVEEVFLNGCMIEHALLNSFLGNAGHLSPVKNDGWKTTFLLGRAIFRGYLQLPGSNHLPIGSMGLV